MPWYERTGMISHRHPFYGVGYFAAEDQGPPQYRTLPDGSTEVTYANGEVEILAKNDVPGGTAEQMGPPSELNRPLTEAEKAAGAAAAAANGNVPAPTPAPKTDSTGLIVLGGAALLVFLLLKRK